MPSYRPKYIPVRITKEREKEIKERRGEIMRLSSILGAFQTQCLAGGLDMEERGMAHKYEVTLRSWLDEDIQDWLMLGGGQDYRKTRQLYELAKSLRKGDCFGMPVI